MALKFVDSRLVVVEQGVIAEDGTINSSTNTAIIFLTVRC